MSDRKSTSKAIRSLRRLALDLEDRHKLSRPRVAAILMAMDADMDDIRDAVRNEKDETLPLFGKEAAR